MLFYRMLKLTSYCNYEGRERNVIICYAEYGLPTPAASPSCPPVLVWQNPQVTTVDHGRI